jgi:hypothetical protein
VVVSAISPTLQSAIDNWDEISPHLEEVYQSLNAGSCLWYNKWLCFNYNESITK